MSTPEEPSIRGISSMATREVLADLCEAYARQSGRRAGFVSVGGVDAARRVRDGEAFDVVVLAGEAIDKLAADGFVDASSRVGIARSGVAIAVRRGAPRPDVTSEAAVRDAVLHARTIGYSTGPSGTHLARLFGRWGIEEAIRPRIVTPAPGVPVGSLVATGEIDLGFQQLAELIHLDGVDVVGPLPEDIQLVTTFTGAVARTAGDAHAAASFLAFLASPAGDEARRRHGMEPARGAR